MSYHTGSNNQRSQQTQQSQQENRNRPYTTRSGRSLNLFSDERLSAEDNVKSGRLIQNLAQAQRKYMNGKRIPGNFPTAYQNSINEEVPDGQKCGNCKLFNQNNSYCSAWKATANKNYWCQSYVPYVNITRSGTVVSSSGGVFSLRDSNNKLITYRKGTTVVYNGELYEVTKNVFGELPDKSSSFVQITNVDDNVIDGGSFGDTPTTSSTTSTTRSSGSGGSSSSGGGY